jgi:leader peptidase (prepilin peptidase) / N-methyltransferase
MDFWTLYWAFVAFVFGAIVGSFLNVCIWRLPRGESLAHPPSHCPACNHRLSLLPDMVPLLSQLWYRSRCRYCGASFSWRYLWVELLTAVTFTAVYFRYTTFAPEHLGETERIWTTLMGMIFVSALITLFFIDLETFAIPDLTVGVALLAGVGKDLFLIARGARDLWLPVWGLPWALPIPLSVLGALLAFWFLWQFAALSTAFLGREAMGAGDSLLLGAMGAFLVPWPLIIVAFISAVTFGTVGGLTGIWLAGRAEERAALPAGEGTEPTPGAPDSEAPGPEAPVAVSPAEGAGDPAPAHRGALDAVDAGDPEEEPGVPALPPSSRWGRLWTVLGTWIAVAAVWGGAALFARSPGLGAVVGLAGAAAAAALLVYGLRLWLPVAPRGPRVAARDGRAVRRGRPRTAVHPVRAVPGGRHPPGNVLRPAGHRVVRPVPARLPALRRGRDGLGLRVTFRFSRPLSC